MFCKQKANISDGTYECLGSEMRRIAFPALLLVLTVALVALGAYVVLQPKEKSVSVADVAYLPPEVLELERICKCSTYVRGEILQSFESSLLHVVQNVTLRWWSENCFLMYVNVSASVNGGYVASISTRFYDSFEASRVKLLNFTDEGKYYHAEYRNLLVTNYTHYKYRERMFEKASMRLKGIGRPSEAGFVAPVRWYLRSRSNVTHIFLVVSNVTYFDGKLLKAVVFQAEIKVGPDSNNSFEEAEFIASGDYRNKYVGANDRYDYYKIMVPEGYVLSVAVNETSAWDDPQNIIVSLYDPNLNLRESVELDPTQLDPSTWSASLSCEADISGYWYVEVYCPGAMAFYDLFVSLNSTTTGKPAMHCNRSSLKGTLYTAGHHLPSTGDPMPQFAQHTVNLAVSATLKRASPFARLLERLRNVP